MKVWSDERFPYNCTVASQYPGGLGRDDPLVVIGGRPELRGPHTDTESQVLVVSQVNSGNLHSASRLHPGWNPVRGFYDFYCSDGLSVE